MSAGLTTGETAVNRFSPRLALQSLPNHWGLWLTLMSAHTWMREEVHGH